MRKIPTILAILLLLAGPAFGQFNTGGFYFAGSSSGKLAFESVSNEFTSNTNSICYGITPESGYFIRNRLAVGGAIKIDGYWTLGGTSYNEYEVVFGPNVRYYLPRDTDMQVFLYGFGGYGFVTDHQLLKFIAGPGVNFFLTERVAFEAGLMYAFTRQWNPEFGGNHNEHDVTFTAGISLFFPTFIFETFGRDPVN